MQATRWAAVGLSAGDLIMARRQLLTLTHLAGRHYRQGTVRIYSADLVPARVRPPASAAVVLDAVMPYPRDHLHVRHVRMWGVQGWAGRWSAAEAGLPRLAAAGRSGSWTIASRLR
jgi:hypothetical protein